MTMPAPQLVQNAPKPPKSHKALAAGIQFLVYFSVFLGGFIVAKLHTLFMSL